MKPFLVILAALMLALPSFAQSGVDNCCQVGRACHSDADWIQGWHDYQAGQCAAPAPAPAAAGVDNCCQVGRACATDADWIQGWHDFQAGQCPVSSTPAVSSPAPAAAGADNCCQVGRACHSDADWVQGWHDFQAGQCPVSSPAGASPAPSQPAASQPAPATGAIDNCCQAGRACQSEADWVRGWQDYQAGQCAAPAVSSPAPAPATQNSYHFSGQNRVRIGPFTLTRGKWEFNPNLGRNADSFMYESDSAGNILSGGQCLTFPTNFHFYSETGSGLRLRAERHEFAVRTTCQVLLYLYPELTFDEVRGQSWSVSLRKTDGNI